MVDKSAEIQELAEAYRANRVAKTSIRAEVKEKYRAVIAEEIRERQMENDVRFANRLARVKEAAGLTLRDIQDGVLRTRTWSTWEYWRDLAGLAPERVSASLAKDAEREARKPYRVENGRVIVTRNESGPVEEFPVASVNRGADGETYVFWGPLVPGEEGYEAFLAAFGKDVNRLSRFLNAAFGEYNETPEEYEEED